MSNAALSKLLKERTWQAQYGPINQAECHDTQPGPGSNGEKRPPVYHLTYEQIEGIKRQAARRATYTAFLLMMSLPCMALRDGFGFGAERLGRFQDRLVRLYEEYEEGRITLEDCRDTLKAETGFSVGRVRK
jgi:hypothetical protein